MQGGGKPAGEQRGKPQGAQGARAYFGVHALKSFLQGLQAKGEKPIVLDLSPASNANLEYFLQFGLKVYLYDILREVSEKEEGLGDANAKVKVATLAMRLVEAFPFQGIPFDGVILWNTLDYLSDLVFPIVLTKALGALRDKGLLYAFFFEETAPLAYERIQIANINQVTVEPLPALSVKRLRTFSNRMIQDLFGGHKIEAFYMTPNGIREVLVRKHS
jgi:hypothetical protein